MEAVRETNTSPDVHLWFSHRSNKAAGQPEDILTRFCHRSMKSEEDEGDPGATGSVSESPRR